MTRPTKERIEEKEISEKIILDPCCGGRMFWFDKAHPNAVYGDIRSTEFVACDGRKITIKPDVRMDFTNIPYASNTFALVVFDPPHLKGAGKTGWMAQKYGTLGDDWRIALKLGFLECMRVLKVHGTLIFKWNEESIKVSELVQIFGKEPLFGHRTRQSSKTIWMTFMKFEDSV